jgi:type I restriction enzyme R subunit
VTTATFRTLLTFHESVVEEAALGYFRELGYDTKFGPDIAPDGKTPERQNWNDVVLVERLKAAIGRINPSLSADAREDAVRRVLRAESPSLVLSNQRFHELFSNGVDIETRRKEGRIAGDKALARTPVELHTHPGWGSGTS